MRPLILTPLYPPAIGGAATYYGQLAEALAARPEIDRLTLLTERLPGLPQRQQEGKLVILRMLPPRIGIPSRSWFLHAASYVQTQLWFVRHLSGLVRKEGVELIHFHTRYGGGMFYRSLRRSALPTVADLRDKLSDPARLANVADRLMCCGEGVQRFAITGGYPPKRLRLIPLAFTPPAAPTAAAIAETRRCLEIDAEPYLLYLGDITVSKGVPELLPAFTRWHDRHPQVQLLLAGMNRLGRKFLDQVATTPATRYLGSVSHRHALALLAGAEIVLLPSRSEGLPRVILEALALGRRVLAPPGIPEFERYIPDYVLPEVSVSAIQAALDRIWSASPPSPYPFHQHRLPAIVEQILDLYAELI